jgi:hypothetical protein
VTGPVAYDPARVMQTVAHWPGGRVPTSSAGVPAYLRSIQSAYMADPNRGYSIGYSEAVDPWGGRWELRGFDWRAAANAIAGEPLGQENARTFALLFIIGADAATLPPAMLEAARDSINAAQLVSGRRLELRGHGDLEPTACPGAAVRLAIVAGALAVPFPPTPPNPGEPDPMNTARIVRLPGYLNTFLVGAGAPLHLTPELLTDYKAAGVPVVKLEAPHAQFTAQLLAQTGLTPADLVAGPK